LTTLTTPGQKLGAPSIDGPRISLNALAQSDDVIAAAAELHHRRRASQAMRDIMLITLARCLPDLAPHELIAAVSRQTDREMEQQL
jgi:hypothetical protein